MAGSLVVLLLVSSSGSEIALAQAANGYTITESWVDQRLLDWAPTAVLPMNFGVPVLRISYGNIYSSWNTPQVVNASLAAIEQTGSNLVRIDMGFDAWLSNDSATIHSFDNYVRYINSSGRRFVLADAAAERYRNYPLSWNDFKYQWLARAYTLAAKYHPYAYVVVKEPGWYYPLISDATYNPLVYNADDWKNLTTALVGVVKYVSPNTKVGVAVAAFDLYNNSAYQGKTSFAVQYLQGVEKIPNLDFIAFDIYDIPGFVGTQLFLNQVGNGGKAVWIAEAWSADGTVVTDPSRSTLDKNWIQALYYFALKIHAVAILPFYSDLFESYGTPPQNSASLLPFLQNRTAVFYRFQEIIKTNQAGQLPTTQTTSRSTTSSSATRSLTSALSTSLASTSTTASSTVGTSTNNIIQSPVSGGQSLTGVVVVLVLIVLVGLVVRRLRKS